MFPASFFLGFLGILYFMNFFQPLVVDDYVFYNDINRLGSFKNFSSWYYLNWTGRIQNTTVIFFALRSKTAILVFNIVNVFVFFGFIWLASWIILGRRPRLWSWDGLFVMLMLFLTWFTIPTLADCVFWKTGSICYLWPMFFLMLFLLPYRLQLDGLHHMEAAAMTGGNKRAFWHLALFSAMGRPSINAAKKLGRNHALVFAILYFLFGIWVGFSNEQVFASAAALMIMWLIFILRKRLGKKVPVYQYLGVAGLIAGGIIQIISPGNYHRLSVRGTGMAVRLDRFMHYFLEVYARIGIRLFIASAVLAALFVIFLLLGKPYDCEKSYVGRIRTDTKIRDRNTRNGGYVLAWLLASLASIAPFVLLPDFAAIRTSFFPACFIVLAAGIAVKYLLEKARGPGYYKSRLAATLFIAVILFADGVHGIKNAHLISGEFAFREKIIEEYKTSNGSGGLEVPSVKTKPYRTVYVYDMGNDPASWINRNVATFYGIDMIRLRQGESSTCSLQHPMVGKLPFTELIRRIQPFDLGTWIRTKG